MSTTPTPFAPTPFILKERFTRIDCPLPGYEGLWVEVRMNLSNGELQELRDALRILDDQITEISERYLADADAIDAQLAALPDDDRAGQRALKREITRLRRDCEDAYAPLHIERQQLVAPHVRAWNLFTPSANGGEAEPVPPPRDDPSALADLPQNVTRWLCQEVLTAFAGGRGFLPGSETSGTAPEPGRTQSSGGPRVVDEPSSSSRTSRKTSRGR